MVSVIGKSDFCANSCKAELIDEALGRNVFKETLFQEKLIDDQIVGLLVIIICIFEFRHHNDSLLQSTITVE